MASLKDDLTNQYSDYKNELEIQTSELRHTTTDNKAEIKLSIEEQIEIAQTKFETALNNKPTKPKYSSINESYKIETPYGKATVYSSGLDEYYIDLANSSLESDKIGRKFLEKRGIKTNDEKLAMEISNYFVCQSIASYIEQEKGNMSAQEYKDATEDIKFQIQNNLKILNQKGFFINTETGELNYATKNYMLLAQQRS